MSDGAAAPLILLPGHLCDARIFAPQAASLGLGAPPVAEMRRDADLASMAARLLDGAPSRFALIGLSMGGMLAAEVIAQAPHRVAGAALLAADAGAARDKEIAWRAEQVAAARRGPDGLATFAAAFMARAFVHSEAAHLRCGPALRAMAAQYDAAEFERQAAALSARQDRHEALARYDAAGAGRLLFLCGAEDRLCPPLLHRRMKEAAPGGRLEIIENCGHIATLERAEEVSAALRAWRARL